MRSVPSAITTGFASNHLAFWVVMVEASGGNTYYWTTTSKNRTDDAFTLKKTSGGSALSPDSTMIAAQDLVTGEQYDGIGPMESGADIYEGGGVAVVSDLEIQILNQARFDETIIQNSINIENRPITIYFGFIPDGASQTVVIDDDMFMRWAGVVEDVMEFDYQTFVLRCVDGSFQRHKDIPTVIINETDYPYAPPENLGKPIPILYGDFTPSDEDLSRELMQISPAPTIKTDDRDNIFYLCDHAVSATGKTYFYSQGLNAFGQILTDPTVTNGASGTYGHWTALTTNDIVVSFIVQPRIPPVAGGHLANPKYAVDDDVTTYAEVTTGLPAADPVFQIPRPNEEGPLTNSAGAGTIAMRYHIRWGTISGAGSENLVYREGVTEIVVGTYSAADSDSLQITSFDYGLLTWELLGDNHWGLETTTSISSQIKNFGIEFYVKVARLFYIGAPVFK